VISRFTRFKEFNGEKKTATKTSNMFKIVPRIGICDAGFSSSKFRSSCPDAPSACGSDHAQQLSENNFQEKMAEIS
jgi:hypothetical protein